MEKNVVEMYNNPFLQKRKQLKKTSGGIRIGEYPMRIVDKQNVILRQRFHDEPVVWHIFKWFSNHLVCQMVNVSPWARVYRNNFSMKSIFCH